MIRAGAIAHTARGLGGSLKYWISLGVVALLGCSSGDDDTKASACEPLTTMCIGDDVYICQNSGNVDLVQHCEGNCEDGKCLNEGGSGETTGDDTTGDDTTGTPDGEATEDDTIGDTTDGETTGETTGETEGETTGGETDSGETTGGETDSGETTSGDPGTDDAGTDTGDPGTDDPGTETGTGDPGSDTGTGDPGTDTGTDDGTGDPGTDDGTGGDPGGDPGGGTGNAENGWGKPFKTGACIQDAEDEDLWSGEGQASWQLIGCSDTCDNEPESNFAECIAQCMMPLVSYECGKCGGDFFYCLDWTCDPHCFPNEGSAACKNCIQTQCDPVMYDCSGVPFTVP